MPLKLIACIVAAIPLTAIGDKTVVVRKVAVNANGMTELAAVDRESTRSPKAVVRKAHASLNEITQKAECSASQKTHGCCNPLGDLVWQFNSTSEGAWSTSANMVRFDFMDDSRCNGTATGRQHGTAWVELNLPQTIQISLSMTGVAESQYEKYILALDGTEVTKVQASNGHGGSSCQVSTCIMCDVGMPERTMTITPGPHVLSVKVDSVDGLYHLGAYFEIMFASLDPACGGCTCSTPTPAPTPCQVSVYEHWPEGMAAGVPGLEAAELAWHGQFPTGASTMLSGTGNHPLPLALSNQTSSVKVEGACCKAYGYPTADCSGTSTSGIPIESTTQLLAGLPAGVVTPATGLAPIWGCNDCAQCIQVTQQC